MGLKQGCSVGEGLGPFRSFAVITSLVSSMQPFSQLSCLRTNKRLGLSMGKALILCQAVSTFSGLIAYGLLHVLLLHLGKFVEDV